LQQNQGLGTLGASPPLAIGLPIGQSMLQIKEASGWIALWAVKIDQYDVEFIP
jgi:hypothetical protein